MKRTHPGLPAIPACVGPAADTGAVRAAIGHYRRLWGGHDWLARLRDLGGLAPAADAWALDDADRVAVAEARRHLEHSWGDRFAERLELLGALALFPEAEGLAAAEGGAL